MTEQNVSRRSIVGGGLALASAAATGDSISPARAQSAPRTFLLIHGAWVGGWYWRRVSDLLEKKGHEVFSPTLTGLGERSHLLSKDINLDTHVTDIVNVVKWEDLQVILASAEKGEQSFPPPAGNPVPIFVNENDSAYVTSKVTRQPIGTYLQPIKLSGARDKVAKKTYIRAIKYPSPIFDKALAECKTDSS